MQGKGSKDVWTWPAREGGKLAPMRIPEAKSRNSAKGRTRNFSERSSGPTTVTDVRVQARFRNTNGPYEGLQILQVKKNDNGLLEIGIIRSRVKLYHDG